MGASPDCRHGSWPILISEPPKELREGIGAKHESRYRRTSYLGFAQNLNIEIIATNHPRHRLQLSTINNYVSVRRCAERQQEIRHSHGDLGCQDKMLSWP
jgi:hypothetical protein